MKEDYYVLVRAQMNDGVLTILNKDDHLDVVEFFPAVNYHIKDQKCEIPELGDI